MSLVDNAKKYKSKRLASHRFSQDEKDLILAWVADDINMAQVAHALEMKNGTAVYNFMLYCMKTMMIEAVNK